LRETESGLVIDILAGRFFICHQANRKGAFYGCYQVTKLQSANQYGNSDRDPIFPRQALAGINQAMVSSVSRFSPKTIKKTFLWG